MNGQPDLSRVLKHMADIDQGLVQLTTELRQCIEEARTINSRQVDRLEQEQASAMLAAAANVEAQVEAEQVSLHNVEDSDSNECANYNPEASASHQMECSRSGNAENQQDQYNMPIIERPPQ